jgi:hypothetical protein
MAAIGDSALAFVSGAPKLPNLSLPTAAPVDRAPRTERPVLAHTVGALRSHRGYLPADMGTKVMSGGRQMATFLSVWARKTWARKTPTDGSKVLDRF